VTVGGWHLLVSGHPCLFAGARRQMSVCRGKFVEAGNWPSACRPRFAGPVVSARSPVPGSCSQPRPGRQPPLSGVDLRTQYFTNQAGPWPALACGSSAGSQVPDPVS
jgi:hypothetical protein